MDVLKLLDSIEEMIKSGTKVPLTGKVMVDPKEIKELLEDIRQALPEEIMQAQYLRDERDRIMNEAKAEYDEIIKTAEEKASELVEMDEITIKAKEKADEILRLANEKSAVMKMNILDYTDNMLYNLQEKVDQLYNVYFDDMFSNLQQSFEKINDNISVSRSEIKDQIYKAQMDNAEMKALPKGMNEEEM